jgi:DNA-binding NtrC family response regulator
MQTLPATFGDDRQSNAIIEQAKSEVLKTVAYALLRQVYGLSEPQRPNIREQINFFDEVRRFEINLIRQALLFANGKKAGAARLLNLNATTLHSKLKLYGIETALETNSAETLGEVLPAASLTGAGLGKLTLAALTDERPAAEVTCASDIETLKAEVIKSIARVLEFKANNLSGVVDFDGQRGVNFYDEVMKFEIELINQAITQANGNQRAAARMLGLKTTTLYSKVKLYKLNLDFIAA